MKLKLTAILMLLLFCGAVAGAQDDVDYRFEIGLAAGGSFYQGDLNHKFFGKTGLAGGAIGRWNINPYMAVKAMLDYASIKGSTDNVSDFYPPDPLSGQPETERRIFILNEAVVDFSVTYEYNFWPFGLHHGYQGRKRITPYAQLGLGAAYGNAGKAFTFQIPIGAGVKYKLKPRVDVGLDLLYHFTMSDKLDNFEKPYGITTAGFKGKDNYCTALLYITYEFSAICPQCNKAE